MHALTWHVKRILKLSAILPALSLLGCDSIPETKKVIVPMAGASQTHTVKQASVICSSRAARAGDAASARARSELNASRSTDFSADCSRIGSSVSCSGSQSSSSGGALGGVADALYEIASSRQAENSLYKECLAEMGYEEIAESLNYGNPRVVQSLRQSAESGDSNSQYELALQSLRGKQYEDAIPWLQRASDQRHAQATGVLGEVYYHGYGVDVNKNRAIDYFKNGVQLNDATSLYYMGVITATGINGVEKDVTRGVEYIRIAATKGHKRAITMLEQLKNPK